MGALYEDVESFFGDIFASYGRVVARCPVPFVLVPVAVCCLLGVGVLNARRESDARVIYTPLGSRASKDRAIIDTIFPSVGDDCGASFARRQRLDYAPFAEVILSAKRDIVPFAQEVEALYRFVANISLEADDIPVTYVDVCACQAGACALESNDGQHVQTGSIGNILSLIAANASFSESNLYTSTDNITESDETRIKLTFHLQSAPTDRRRLSLLWELRFLEEMKTYSSDGVSVTYIASQSLDNALGDHMLSDVTTFMYAMVAMLVYATLVGSGGNCVLSYVTLAYAGVLAAFLAIIGAFGALSLCGIPFVDMCAVMPFIVLGESTSYSLACLVIWGRRYSCLASSSTLPGLPRHLRPPV